MEKALSYDRRNDTDDRGRDAEMDIPLLRWCCVELAHAMANEGLENKPVIVKWIERATTDPLPEVRYVSESREVISSSDC